MVYRKISSASAHAAHHFIGDQPNLLAAANLCDLLQISCRRHYGAESRTADRLKDYRCHSVIRIGNCLFNFGRVFLAAVEAAIATVVGATVTIRGAYCGE